MLSISIRPSSAEPAGSRRHGRRGPGRALLRAGARPPASSASVGSRRPDCNVSRQARDPRGAAHLGREDGVMSGPWTEEGGAEGPQLADTFDRSLRRVLDNIRDYAIFMMDGERHVVGWNAGAERILG